MHILVTNDDGIDSPGLHALAEHLSTIGDVTVFAPSGEYSGAGAAIGHLANGIPDVYRVEREEMPSVTATYHLDAPPAMTSLLTCSGLFDSLPDIVVSGINPGWNVGHAVHFSGTIGACVTAGVFGIPGVAVSQHRGNDDPHQWATAAEAAVEQVPRAISEAALLNVNVPNIAMAEVKGVVDTRLGDRIPYSLHSPSMSEREPGRFEIDFERFGPFENLEGTDTHAVLNGYISVTPLASTHARPST